MDPPPGVTADLENPEDVLWTINLVTQSLTLAICSFFVLTRVLQRFRMPGWLLSVDECMFTTLLLEDYTNISTDLTILSWVLMTGYCISGIFRKSLRLSFALKLLTSTQLVSIHGGGRHMWEVTSDEVTRFLKVCTVPL
jgi:hypothetical protein